MNPSITTTRRSPEALRSAIVGDVVVPGDDSYDAARRPFNLAADLRPAVVVFAESVGDVLRAVQFARSHGIRSDEEVEPDPERRYPSVRSSRACSSRKWRSRAASS